MQTLKSDNVAQQGSDLRVASVLYEASKVLAETGVESSRLDAALLLGHGLGLTREQLVMQHERVLTEKEKQDFDKLLLRRLGGEPVAYILGYKEFWGMEFAVSPEVLIPRPDTETLVEAVLRYYPDREADLRILDLGTGSGCIALSLLSEYPHARALAVDASQGALAVAKVNAAKLMLAKRCDFLLSNWLENVSGQFDLVVSNPPYITRDAYVCLEKDIREYEPEHALLGSEDGLGDYKTIIKQGRDYIVQDGMMMVEIGAEQSAPVSKLFSVHGYDVKTVCNDLAGLPRVVVAALA